MIRRNITDLSNDELTVIGMLLDLPELLSFCSSSKRINNVLCKNNTFWRNKLLKEHPNILPLIADSNYTYREIYEDLYSHRDDNIYSVKYSTKPLSIEGVVKGFVEEYTHIYVLNGEDFPIGSRVWVAVNNRPDILFPDPIIEYTRKRIEELILSEITLQLDNDDDLDEDIGVLLNKYRNIVKTNDLIKFNNYEFLIKQVEVV